MEIKSKQDFEANLQKFVNSTEDRKEHSILTSFYCPLKESLIIDNIDFSIDLYHLDFSGFTFKNCNFHDNDNFSELTFRACLFEKCTFKNSYFNDIKFLECEIIDTAFEDSALSYFIFGDCNLKNTQFFSCPDVIEFYFGGCNFDNVSFQGVYLTYSRFEGHTRENYDFKLAFSNSFIGNNSFNNFDLSDSDFKQCVLEQTTFSNCYLKSTTINNTNKSRGNEFSFIDFQTILKSDKIDPIVLEKCFGINESIIKDKIAQIATKIEYQTIFISYSFKDKQFANNLNKSLIRKGVVTFLWENDAPGGKDLKKIMRENIKEKDRLLFIASENSLRSKACQYELLEGSKKQEQLWQEILFPIHIDNYLFEIEKDEIKPIEKQDEYWKNILELRDIKSIDFTRVVGKYRSIQFDKKVTELITGLKKY
jgi:uncharacterized protein YjbI with pentapeptide repeats